MSTADGLPNRIREFRKARGMKLQHLADRIGCGVSLLSALELGNRQLTQHWMERIAKALRVKVPDLFCDKDGGSGISIEESEMLDRLRSASPEQQKLIVAIAKVIVPRMPPKS